MHQSIQSVKKETKIHSKVYTDGKSPFRNRIITSVHGTQA